MKKNCFRLFISVFLLFIGNSVVSAQEYGAFYPGEIWKDNNGVHINAHGGGILFHEGKYYWFGEHKSESTSAALVGVTCYSSADLYNWTNEGIALAVSDDNSSDIAKGCILERPKVIYNAHTKQFVMYFHLELRGQGYNAARVGVAVSDKATGPYRFLKSYRPNAGRWPLNMTKEQRQSTVKATDFKEWWTPEWRAAVNNGMFTRRDFEGGQMSRDMTLYVDDDGKAYHIYSSEENLTLNLAELSDDYLSYTGKYIRIAPGGHNEAPAIFKKDGKYFMITSGCTGWDPNAARLFTANNIMGEWTEHPNPCVGDDADLTFHSQSTFILPVQGKKDAFIFMADRWTPRHPIDARYIWLPVQFENGLPTLKWQDKWDLSVFDSAIDLIKKVNARWQSQHPAEQGNAFWHNAAYHTGNMAAYAATGNEEYRKYSEKWAEKNQWKGAKSDKKADWKYNYGETDEHVLFGDWQICFQTYIDLYNLQPDKKKIARAREVMEYEMSTAANDYWWWADGLYMVMPVMVKLHKVTGNEQYLNKLYEYFSYAKNLMYDTGAGLFYRDAKYVYPKHKTNSGKKDFWARGNGWVFAGLAKVLQDLPKDNPHRSEYISVYQSLAKSLAASQQSEGYWTRSILDESQAPGYETSGTAFFAYGFLWGVNNGILDGKAYAPVINKAWNYLTQIALQPDGTVGYVQPIGERADQHANVTSTTTADFGVGAFLLAASEMTKYKPNNDRAFWAQTAYRIAAPVLSNMSKGELSKNMQLELSPTWDGRDKRVSYMECFGRLMDGIAPWLTLPDDDTDESKMRKQLREWALKSYAHAVNPDSPDYLLWRNEGQPLVDAAYIASSFLRAPKQLWEPLDTVTKQRYIAEFQQLRRIDPPNTNWLMFSATIETFLLSVGAQYDMYRIHSAIRKIEDWYVGDGWYSDGEHFAFDYYNSYVIQPMYVQVLKELADSKLRLRDRSADFAQKQYEKALKRMQRYGMILERFVSPEGTFPVFGRSMTYRLGIFQPLSLLVWKENLPQELPEGQVRNALTAAMKRMFSVPGNFNDGGFLQLGFAGYQPKLADWYTNNGSLYLTSEVFLPLGLPANHSFWTAPALDWTAIKAWNGADFPKDHAINY